MNLMKFDNDFRTKLNQKVIAAACKIVVDGNEVILCGVRHFDPVMNSQIKAIKESAIEIDGNKDPYNQGFVDQYGNFLTRKEAMDIVKQNGQPFDYERNGSQDDILYSEGVW